MIKWVSAPLVGLIKCYHKDNVPQDLWETGEWAGYIEKEDVTYYFSEDADTGNRTYFAVKED